MPSAFDRTLLAALALIALAGCANEATPWRPGPQGTPRHLAERECPPDSTLTWGNFGAPFMLSWCTGCHAGDLPEGSRRDAPMDVNLDHLDDVRANMDLVWAEAGDHNTSMPPAGGPSADEREMLGEWLACGAMSRADLHAPAGDDGALSP